MLSNIKQRKDATGHDKPNRKKAAEILDPPEYTKRLLMEGIFGAEETRRYRSRFVLEENKSRFAKGRVIAWNIRTLNLYECASNIPIRPYGRAAHAT